MSKTKPSKKNKATQKTETTKKNKQSAKSINKSAEEVIKDSQQRFQEISEQAKQTQKELVEAKEQKVSIALKHLTILNTKADSIMEELNNNTASRNSLESNNRRFGAEYLQDSFARAVNAFNAAESINEIPNILVNLRESIAAAKEHFNYAKRAENTREEIAKIEQSIKDATPKRAWYQFFKKDDPEISAKISGLEVEKTELQKQLTEFEKAEQLSAQIDKENKALAATQPGSGYEKLSGDLNNKLEQCEKNISELKKSKPYFFQFAKKREFNKDLEHLNLQKEILLKDIKNLDKDYKEQLEIANNSPHDKAKKTKYELFKELETAIVKSSNNIMSEIAEIKRGTPNQNRVRQEQKTNQTNKTRVTER